MKIYDFDIDQELAELDNYYQKVSDIRISLSEKRVEFRNFCSAIQLENDTLFSCCNEYEKLLTIQCYTFSERLLKNLVYALINKDGHTSLHINNFINKKVPVESFSPNVKLENFESEIRTFFKDFRFIFNLKHIDSKIYNELIKERHVLAHVGKYSFNFEQYISVINIIKIISFESKSLMMFQEDVSLRNKLQELFIEFKRSIIRIRTSDINNIKYNYKELRLSYYSLIDFLNKYNLKIESLFFHDEIIELDSHLSNVDLRENELKLLEKYKSTNLINPNFLSIIKNPKNFEEGN